MPIPNSIRLTKHLLFSFLPGGIGSRNRACYRWLTRKSAKPVFRSALSRIGPGSVCIDCGANVGAVTKLMAETGATVHAFEPDPWTFSVLKENTSHLPNVLQYQKAVGARNQEAVFYRSQNFETNPESGSLATSTIPRGVASKDSSFTVDMIDITEFIRRFQGNIDLLKLDVEGSECEILEKMISMDLVDNIKYVFVETHELQFEELIERTEKIRSALKARGAGHINLDWH